LLFRKAPGIGLDIGSRKIKLVRVRKSSGGLQIIKWGSRLTPPGMVDAGVIYDPERLGEVIGGLVKEMDLHGRNVVAAVSGPQVYTRALIMPRMKLDELKEAVKYEATTFLPIAVEEAAMDVFPLREFEDEDGKKLEVFFVAVRRQQVEYLQAICRIASLKLGIVEIEALALNRALNHGSENHTVAFLNIGATRSYFSVFEDNLLVFNRNLAFGCSAFYQGTDFDLEIADDGLDNVEITPGGQRDYLVRDIVSEVARSVEYYNMQNPNPLDKIILCGGGSRLQGMEQAIATGINCPVEIGNPFTHFIKPAGLNEKSQRELRHDFAVALGLATRGVM
jgi:type IV pilus assembly protein PilM